jgi:hypothetical protein
MSKALDISTGFGRDSIAKYISMTWFDYRSQMDEQIKNWKELRNYIFATSTRTTTNKKLPWKNSTTLPKLCQLRDNLHSNYISALFPNDEWMKWEGYSKDDALKEKTKAIEAYMSNKTRTGHFRHEVSRMVYDYIDYGNAFATAEYEHSFITNAAGERVTNYIGPKAKRISPYDIVFNPLAGSFRDSFKIIRSLKNRSELKVMSQEQPDNAYLHNALQQGEALRKHMAAYGIEEDDKSEGFLVDGFGSYQQYLGSDYVEFLDFYGDVFNTDTNELEKGQKITIVDRMWVIDKKPFPQWSGHAPIYHVGWRTRSDNLWAMGPLENLVGMQYRIDHLENLKADAMDLAVLPPLVIKGEVEEFEWMPGAEIHVDENGDVTELAKNVQWVLQTDNAIQLLEQRMEQYAGAPREAMGIRTAGEKTAFEVQQLTVAAGRIFQEKATNFELELLEEVLNAMLETAKRNLDADDVARVIDDDLGVTEFIKITKEDITASGKIRPIGARHFAAQAQLVQNLTSLSQTPIWQQISQHVQSKNLANLVEDVLGLGRYDLFSPNAAVFDQQETQRLAGQASEDLEVEQSLPVEE